MSSWHGRGSIDTPIEISESDDDPDSPGSPMSIIDLTAEEPSPIRGVLSTHQSRSATNDGLLKSPFSRKQSSRNHKTSTDSVSASFSTGEEIHSLWQDDSKSAASTEQGKLDYLDLQDETTRVIEEELVPDGQVVAGLSAEVEVPTSPPREDVNEERADYDMDASQLPLLTEGALAQAQKALFDPTNDLHSMLTTSRLAIEGILLKMKKEMEDDHAIFVRFQLFDALKRQNEYQESLPDFRDEVDPFADMLPVKEGGSGAIELRESVVSQVQKKRHVVGSKRVPPYKHYTSISQNILAGNNYQLPYEPYTVEYDSDEKEAAAKWYEELRAAYPCTLDADTSCQVEKAYRFREYLPKVLECLRLDMEDIVSHISSNGTKSGSATASTTIVGNFLAIFKVVFKTKLQDMMLLELGGHEICPKSSRQPAKSSRTIQGQELLLKDHLTACPLCHVNGCEDHGDYESSDSDDDPTKTKKVGDLNMPFKSLLLRDEERSERNKCMTNSESVAGSVACSPDCFLHGYGNVKVYNVWTLEDTNFLHKWCVGLKSKGRAACELAPSINKTCSDVYQKISSIFSTWEDTSDEPRGRPTKPKKLEWYDNKRKKIRTDTSWGAETKSHLHHERKHPIGCEHPGVPCHDAGSECSCLAEKILCDKFCACSEKCHMRFTGCKCSRTDKPCSPKSECVCILLNRECDPDLCHTCGAIETADPFKRQKDNPIRSCCNTAIQKGVDIPLIIGTSTHPRISGSGAFLAEPVKRGKFIAEYVGEIISHEEADRRHIIYDKFQISYLFTLNHAKSIDSYRFGNTTRFINHSQKYANCFADIKLVNGTHRIGFFALKNIKAGMELFFDYGNDFIKVLGLEEMENAPLQGEEQAGNENENENETDSGEADDEMEAELDEEEKIQEALAKVPDYDTDEYEEEQRDVEQRSAKGRERGRLSGRTEKRRRVGQLKRNVAISSRDTR